MRAKLVFTEEALRIAQNVVFCRLASFFGAEDEPLGFVSNTSSCDEVKG